MNVATARSNCRTDFPSQQLTGGRFAIMARAGFPALVDAIGGAGNYFLMGLWANATITVGGTADQDKFLWTDSNTGETWPQIDAAMRKFTQQRWEWITTEPSVGDAYALVSCALNPFQTLPDSGHWSVCEYCKCVSMRL